MQLALDYNLPVVIHTRNAIDEAINTVKPFAIKGLKGIFIVLAEPLNKQITL